MRKFFLLIILLLFLINIGFVFAGGNNSSLVNPTVHVEDDVPVVVALESGDSNISFSDDYKGYCVEWGEHSAEVGDKFYIHRNGVDNNIKVFFTYFYEESQRDVIATQHMIWKFTDNKEFSRFNHTLYDLIVDKARSVNVSDDGVRVLDDGTSMFYSFRLFVAGYEESQNYFGYKIFFKNTTSTNQSLNETITNNTNNTIINSTFNETLLGENQTVIRDYNKTTKSSIRNSINIMKTCGNPLLLLFITIPIIFTYSYRRKK